MLEISPEVAVSDDAGGARNDTGSVHPLLEVQRLDTESEQLMHRRDTLPARCDLEAASAAGEQLRAKLDSVAAERLEVLVRHKRLEQEAAIVEAKADTDDNRLYSGEVRGIRDLQALQEEVAGLRSRQGHLEDQAIAALIEAEELEEAATALRAELEVSDQAVTVLQAEVASAEAEIDGHLAAARDARAVSAERLGASTLDAYDRLRGAFGPSTAVEFDPSSGCGCPSQMPAAEVARIKRCPEGSVEGCSECGRLVIR